MDGAPPTPDSHITFYMCSKGRTGGLVQKAALGVIWGKSNAQGSMHLLLGHLFDTAAVSELIWDGFLSPVIRNHLNEGTGGRGRSLFALLCGLHDVGKATPAFQMKDADLAQQVRATGFSWNGLTRDQAARWHHTRAGAVVVRHCLREAGWGPESCSWVWPMVAGHHGFVPGRDRLTPSSPTAQGRGAWPDVQRLFVDTVSAELGLDLASFAAVTLPRRANQLALSGLIIMADWIASDESNFGGLPDLSMVSLDASRVRARRAWDSLGLRGGWIPGRLAPRGKADLVLHRFGVKARPSQAVAESLARDMPAPGLLILEAPMGEGKTEAALAAAEVLAARFGADGIFVGMPTQATSDPMFTRMRTWLTAVDPEVPVALLHGRARFNQEWASLRATVRLSEIDCIDTYGMADELIGSDPDRPRSCGEAAAEWFLGRKRGLLAPVTVGTVDQLLHAATRTKHVMLRHAGLAGRVVVLDEVHAYDVYMSQFLFEALRWLGDAGVPVIVLSATLPPSMRAQLVRAYLQGATQTRDVDTTAIPLPSGYPSVTAVSVTDTVPHGQVESGSSWRPSMPVQVEILPEATTFDPATVASAVIREIAAGGCALVVCNTVNRAQAVYRALQPTFGSDCVLLHARLIAAERAVRAERLIDLLGAPGRRDGAARPRRLVVVATQVAEQSFDVDVDLLVTDLAPIDLLLQRIGRLHRHAREAPRPLRVSAPTVIVGGVRFLPGQPPTWPAGSRAVYGDHLLLRAAALVSEAAGQAWSIPAAVPDLVARGYADGPLGPPEWSDAAARAAAEWSQRQEQRQRKAKDFLLAGEEGLGLETLAGLHERSTASLDNEEQVAAVVRDGEPSVEVVLVRRAPGGYFTLGGRRLGPNGEAVSDPSLMEEVAGATIRLPANSGITAAALAELRPLAGWTSDPWLGRARALILDEQFSVVLGRYLLAYDDEVGLRHQLEGQA